MVCIVKCLLIVLAKPTLDAAVWANYCQQIYSQLSVPQSQPAIQAITVQQPSVYGAPARTTVTPQPSKFLWIVDVVCVQVCI